MKSLAQSSSVLPATLALLALTAWALDLDKLQLEPGIPPELVGVWVEERDPGEGQAATVTRIWAADGAGLVSYARLSTNDSTLEAGTFVRDVFVGWSCIQAGRLRFVTNTTDISDGGSVLRTRVLCLEGALVGDALSYNYSLLSEGCPQGHQLYTARRIPARYPAAEASACG